MNTQHGEGKDAVCTLRVQGQGRHAYIGTHVHRHTGTPAHKHTGTQVHRHTGMQARVPYTQAHRPAGTHTHISYVRAHIKSGPIRARVGLCFGDWLQTSALPHACTVEYMASFCKARDARPTYLTRTIFMAQYPNQAATPIGGPDGRLRYSTFVRVDARKHQASVCCVDPFLRRRRAGCSHAHSISYFVQITSFFHYPLEIYEYLDVFLTSLKGSYDTA